LEPHSFYADQTGAGVKTKPDCCYGARAAYSGHSAKGNPMLSDQLINEAKAKITWGESPADVHKYLVTYGMTPEEADAAIKS
jgi:hypothetical protein